MSDIRKQVWQIYSASTMFLSPAAGATNRFGCALGERARSAFRLKTHSDLVSILLVLDGDQYVQLRFGSIRLRPKAGI